MTAAEADPPTTLITGASRGIGRSIALRLARLGHRLVLNYRSNTAAAERTGAECLARGAREVILVPGDVGTPRCQSDLDESVRGTAQLTGLVCNAAHIATDLLWRMKSGDVWASWEINTLSAARLILLLRDRLACTPGASVVLIGSVVGEAGEAGNASYVSSKAAHLGLVRALGRALGPSGVRVNLITPGFIETDLTATFPPSIREMIRERIPLRRFGTADDVADAAQFLLGSNSAFITGQVIRVNGGRLM